MSASKTIQTEELSSTGPNNRLTQHHTVRATAHEILASFSKVLTDREQMILHWLADGMAVREIAERLHLLRPPAIESRHKSAGGARSLSPNPPGRARAAQNKIARPRPRGSPSANAS
jgi:hypothetical protein